MQNNINFNTNYQIGDNNVNIGPQPRILNDSTAEQLANLLDKSKSIRITAVLGDGEAFNFATQIKNFLFSKGYTVEGVDQAVYAQPVMGQVVEKNSSGGFEIIIGTKQ